MGADPERGGRCDQGELTACDAHRRDVAGIAAVSFARRGLLPLGKHRLSRRTPETIFLGIGDVGGHHQFSTPCKRHHRYKVVMRLALKLHPDSRCSAVSHIEVDVVRARSAGLALRYCVTGTIGNLRLPGMTTTTRADELWRHTCFEVFVRALPLATYHEFNFSPSTRWAAFRFSGYREGMTVASEVSTPGIDVQSNAESYQLEAALALDGLTSLPSDAIWRLGVSVVIEETSGALSYWALAHPTGRADFHHSDCFAHELSAA